MKNTIRYAAVAALTVGVLGAGAAVVLAPAWAGQGPGQGPEPSEPAATEYLPGPGPYGHGMRDPGQRHGMGGHGMGEPGHVPGMGRGMGSGMGNGMGGSEDGCPWLLGAESGTLTPAQEGTLAARAEQLKLAQDLYQAFGETHDDALFRRVAHAESRHLAAVRTLLDRYGVADPTEGQAAGQFADAGVQAAYDAHLSEGNGSLAAALAVATELEQSELDAIADALEGLDAPDVTQVYEHLLVAGQRHHTAFSG